MNKISLETIHKMKELRELGYSYSLIAKELFISKSTVSYYLSDSKNHNKATKYFYNDKIEKICKCCNKIFLVTKKAKGEYCRECFYNGLKGYKISLEDLKDKLLSNSLNRNLDSNLNNKIKVLLLKDQNNKCSICGIEPMWNNKKLVFILDHIDGKSINNNYNNLRCICPNCDSQLDTYKSKNKNSTRNIRYTKKEKELFNLDKIYESLNKGNTYDGVRLECGNPPKSLISKVMKDKFPETINMNSIELQIFRDKLFNEYIKNN